jgi:hypothetical protein
MAKWNLPSPRRQQRKREPRQVACDPRLGTIEAPRYPNAPQRAKSVSLVGF